MRHLGRFSLSLLASLAAVAVSYYFASLLLLLFDSNYHDGFAAIGGLIIGLIVGTLVFRAIWKKLGTWVQEAH